MFVDKNGDRIRIINGWYCSEKIYGGYPVDGVVQIDDQLYLINFDGCFWHECSCVDGQKINHRRKPKEEDEQRNNVLRNFGTLIIIKSCEFQKEFNKYEEPLYISKTLYRGLYNGKYIRVTNYPNYLS